MVSGAFFLTESTCVMRLPLAVFGCMFAVALASALRAQIPQPLLPEGFVEDRMTGEVFERASGMEILPDGRVLILEHGLGAVILWDRGRREELGRLPDCGAGLENGLLGITLDAAFPQRPFLYLYWTRVPANGGAQDNRITRVELLGDLAAGTDRSLAFGEVVDLVTGLEAQGDHHNGGALQFGTDGLLYLTTGDNGQAAAPQDPTRSPGKVLRFRVDHLPLGLTMPPSLASMTPPGPAHFSGGGWAPFCFALGLRNPFRFRVNPANGSLVVVDVGESDFEEVNVAFGGENFGWPYFEANLPRVTPMPPILGSLTAPVAAGTHMAPLFFEAAILLGGPYHAPRGARHAFPPEYEGNWFVADLGFPGPLFRGRFDAAGGFGWAAPVPGQINNFAWGETIFAVDGRVGADGALWYLSMIPGDLRRIRPRSRTSMLRLGGNAQAGNGGHWAARRLEVRLLDVTGRPRRGEVVHFSVGAGGGFCSPAAVTTDANGKASTVYRFAAEYPANEPRIVAWHPDCAPCFFDLQWRGLEMLPGSGGGHRLEVQVHHSAPNSPVTLVAEPAPPAPLSISGAGALWTSILAPGPALRVVGDGLGVFGPASPAWRTGPDGRLRQMIALPPSLQLDAVLQAFAYDFGRSGAEAIMVSNPLRFSRP
jgi:glucose/arabinose dehydrogenase